MRTPKVIFRVDASLQIGTGHVMRCLTLANALTSGGAQCHFICRNHFGNLAETIRQRGFEVTLVGTASAVPVSRSINNPIASHEPAHAVWLGCNWEADMQEARAVLHHQRPDWLVVDHYALDRRWESALRPYCKRVMVIDDLADRPHQCDLLLDQNLGRKLSDYETLVPSTCTLLLGPQYALLRPDFATLRSYSLNRRSQPQVQNILVTRGGVDRLNATGQMLKALSQCNLPEKCSIDVVMGSEAPWLDQVRVLAAKIPRPTTVAVNVDDMALRMAECDLAIGAAGSTSWERCSLGVPSLMTVLAENQREAAAHLEHVGAALRLPINTALPEQLNTLIQLLMRDTKKYNQMVANSSGITDGRGVERVLSAVANFC